MKPAFSEFSYGFALVHELCQTTFAGLRIAPAFPSLIEEGQPGAGHDVHLARPGMPVFLQFKISQYMVRESAGQWEHFGMPYYRFWLHSPRRSSQHQSLVERDVPPNIVLYAAPSIHEAEHLNNAFHYGTVVDDSVFFRPGDIGLLNDNEDHCVAFIPGAAFGYFCSEPRQVGLLAKGRTIFERLEVEAKDRPRVQPTIAFFNELAESLETAARRGAAVSIKRFEKTADPQRRARRRAAYAVRTLLDAELLWLADVDPE